MVRRTAGLVFVAILASAALSLKASRTPKSTTPRAAETPAGITAAILKAEDLLDDAESHHQVEAVKEMIADDYRGVTVGGGIIAKRDVLMQVGGKEEASSESKEREVRAFGDGAVYTALVFDKGTDEKTGEPYILATRVMDVWQKRGRDWKLVADEATGVALDRR